MIHLTEENLNAATLGNVQFCSFAESGAMGCPGKVIFANSGNEWFDTNYCFGKASLETILRACPALEQFVMGTAQTQDGVPQGWRYIHMGAGNHLLVRDGVYDAFMRELGQDKKPMEIYGTWQKCAAAVLTRQGQSFPVKMVLESGLMGYNYRPLPDEDISQTLTINNEGDIWLSSEAVENLETWKTVPRKKLYRKAQAGYTSQLINEIYACLAAEPIRAFATDVSEWSVTFRMQDGSEAEYHGSMFVDEELVKITEDIRKLFPDLGIAGFGYDGELEGNAWLKEIGEGTAVYNTTFGFGAIKYFVGDVVRVEFASGIKAFKYPDSFEKKKLVRAEEAETCSEPYSPITSITLERTCTFHTIHTEQFTVWLKKKKGRINRFKGDNELCETKEFAATASLKEYLFELVTGIDRQRPWRAEYDPCVDDTGIDFTINYATGHRKHITGNIMTIPRMEQIDGIMRLMAAEELAAGDDVTYVHGTREPVFRYWLEEDAEKSNWDDPRREDFRWPLMWNTPDRFVSEYRKYVTDRMEGKN